jgi:two-component system sensor histidine kinase YesM
MLQRKLVLVNITIITLTLAIITMATIYSLRNLFYKQNSLVYESILDDDYDKLQTVFKQGEDYVLQLCTDANLQELLRGDQPAATQFKKAVSQLSGRENWESVTVLPVSGQDVYGIDEITQDWICYSDALEYYPNDYRYSWRFRPDGKDCLRVMRAMFDQQDITRIIAIISVDISLPTLAEMFYTFGVRDDLQGTLCLVDANNNYLLPYHKTGVINLPENTVYDLTAIKYSLRDEQVTVAKEFHSNNWKMVAVIDQPSFMVDSTNAVVTLIFSSLLLEILAVVLTAMLTKRLTNPVLQLASEMQQSGQKEKYEHLSLPVNASGEVKTLYDSYNYLIDEVNKSIKNIQEISRKESENQFMRLQAEINPHFLYNTLNAISWMAQNNQNKDIQKTVVALVGMFRASLNNGKPFISLQGEMEQVRCYLSIMQYRYPDSYTMEFDVAEDTKELMVIKQILQPLAENALTHGFLEAAINGRIVVSSRIEDDYLILSMSNTGAKIDMELVSRLLNNDPKLTSKHYGIRNVNNRLISFYGPECGLHYRTEGNETIVTIKLPLDKVRPENNNE